MAVNFAALRGMGTTDLRELNAAVVAVINERVREMQRERVRQFRVGDKASFRCSRTGRIVVVQVDRLNTKSVGCTELSATGSRLKQTWRVAPSHLSRIEV